MNQTNDETKYTTIETAADVTDEIIEIALDIADGWYQTGPIDWEDLIDRIDGNELADGTMIDLGDSMVSPAINKIKRIVRKHRND